ENGYNTVIAENGKSLSGGERQRISIARALLKNAPILLLDEATASLDPENEEQVQKALTSLLKKGTTVIVIAHRLRTVIDADKIVVLKGGKLEEEGNHALLMEHDGLYKRLYDLQQESLNWSAKA
ncbi:MAG: ATP-binding cassette domain-containing protein, partial [Clostridia bacterium]|nr:ATP-binding cassette domain-containing protein [Clostridia bacterium]